MRSEVMLRKWQLDGEDSPMQRACATWQEVCMAIDQLLATRCDAKAPGDSIANLTDGFKPSFGNGSTLGGGSGGGVTCNYCKR